MPSLEELSLHSSPEEVLQYFQELISSKQALTLIGKYAEKTPQELVEVLAHPVIQTILARTWEYESNTDIWEGRDTIRAVKETAAHTMTGIQASIIHHLSGDLPDPSLQAYGEDELRQLKSDADSLNSVFYNLIGQM